MSNLTAALPEDESTASEILNGCTNPEWEYIDERTIYSDLEKGYEEKEVVLQRKSDSNFFKFKYADAPQCDLDAPGLSNSWPLVGEQVFPKTKTITVYE